MENIQVSFTDTSKECIQMMRKLAKEALKEGTKVVQPIIRESIPVKRGLLKRIPKIGNHLDNIFDLLGFGLNEYDIVNNGYDSYNYYLKNK